MIIVSCPYCYKATYVVVAEVRKHRQSVLCGYCRNEFVIVVRPRRGRSRKFDVDCLRLERAS